MVQFNDARLQESMAQMAPVIEGRDGRLDTVSGDIRALEAYLADKFSDPFLFELGHALTDICGDWDGDPGTLYGEVEVEAEVERLAVLPTKRRWRLMYVRVEADGEYFGNGWGKPVARWLCERKIECRPLIETKADVRLRVAKALPDFVHAVGDHFGYEPPPTDARDLPF